MSLASYHDPFPHKDGWHDRRRSGTIPGSAVVDHGGSHMASYLGHLSTSAMLIAGLVVFLAYDSPDLFLRGYLAGGTMLGFASHLVLDELCSVDFNGAKLQLNKFAGSAFKLFSPSWSVTLAAYTLLS